MIAVIAGLVLARIYPQQQPETGLQPAESFIDLNLSGEDNALDLPWLASWSATDRTARKGQTCTVLSKEPGPANTTIEIVSSSCEAGMAHTQAGDRSIPPESLSAASRPD